MAFYLNTFCVSSFNRSRCSNHFFPAFYLSFSFQLYLVGSWETSILVIPVGLLSRQDLDGDGQLSMAEFWEGDMAPGGEMMLRE